MIVAPNIQAAELVEGTEALDWSRLGGLVLERATAASERAATETALQQPEGVN